MRSKIEAIKTNQQFDSLEQYTHKNSIRLFVIKNLMKIQYGTPSNLIEIAQNMSTSSAQRVDAVQRKPYLFC